MLFVKKVVFIVWALQKFRIKRKIQVKCKLVLLCGRCIETFP